MTKQEYLTASILTHAAKQLLDTSAPRAGACANRARHEPKLGESAAIRAVGTRVFPPPIRLRLSIRVAD